MKRKLILLILIAMMVGKTVLALLPPMGNQPDSVYLFAYANQKNSNSNGLHFAWSTDQKNWKAIGPEYRFLFCDVWRVWAPQTIYDEATGKYMIYFSMKQGDQPDLSKK